MSDFEAIFARIRPMFLRHAARAVPMHDDPGRYYLATHEVRAKDGYRTWFGGVEIKKSYVSAHLIPVYEHPDLLADAPDALKKRMQGKSCFNFKKPDDPALADLDTLIDAAATRFTATGKLAG